MEKLHEQIREMAKRFVDQNFNCPTQLDYLAIENAMIAASILTLVHINDTTVPVRIQQ